VVPGPADGPAVDEGEVDGWLVVEPNTVVVELDGVVVVVRNVLEVVVVATVVVVVSGGMVVSESSTWIAAEEQSPDWQA
jgi:ABC-type nitrate/sulfonate/bicarbonate transport system substrate-binding protein